VDKAEQNILYVGGSLAWNSGNPYSGNIVAPSGEGLGSIVNNSLAYYNCGLIQNNQLKPVVEEAKTAFIKASAAIAALPSTASSVKILENGALEVVFPAGSKPSLHVVSLSSSMLSQFSSVQLVNYDASASFLVFNIAGASGAEFQGIDFTGLVASRTLFNLYEHKGALPIANVRVEGSILAPFADVQAGTGVVVGQVIVNSSVGSTQYNQTPLQYNHEVCVGFPISALDIELDLSKASSALDAIQKEFIVSSASTVSGGWIAAAVAVAFSAVQMF
jgi:choice-of-anchor A domain-containing protein